MSSAIGKTAATLTAMVALMVVRALVLVALWAWFVAETFHLQTLTLGQAMGLSLVVQFLTYQYDARNDTEDKDYYEALLVAFIAGLLINAMSYLAGAVIHGVMPGV